MNIFQQVIFFYINNNNIIKEKIKKTYDQNFICDKKKTLKSIHGLSKNLTLCLKNLK